MFPVKHSSERRKTQLWQTALGFKTWLVISVAKSKSDIVLLTKFLLHNVIVFRLGEMVFVDGQQLSKYVPAVSDIMSILAHNEKLIQHEL